MSGRLGDSLKIGPTDHDRTHSPTEKAGSGDALVRARQMVAETLLPHGHGQTAARGPAVRKVVLFGGLVLLAVMAGLAYCVWR